MAVLISLSLKLPPCSGKEARINAVAFLRELSIWMWTFLSLTARLRSNGGEALDWHITIKWMSSDAAKKEEQPNQHFGCSAKQCVGSETQTMDAKQTSSIQCCSQDPPSHDQPRTECMETKTRPRPWEVENKSSEPWENNRKILQNKQTNTNTKELKSTLPMLFSTYPCFTIDLIQ